MKAAIDNLAMKTVAWSMVANFVLAVIKWVSGHFGHSYALIADAIESSTDVVASLLVLLALKYASRPADQNHPYGHGKIEPLVTFIVVLFLIISAGIIAHESIQNIQTPHELPKPFTLVVLMGVIVWKEISYRFVNKQSTENHSTSLKAEAWHHRSDSITSMASFLGIAVAIYMGPGYEAADDWAALMASVFILYNCFLIFRPALGEVMDEHLYDDIVKEVRNVAMTVDGIVGTEKCYIRKAGMKYHVDLHAIVDGNISVRKGHSLAHDLEDQLFESIPAIAHIIIHIEPL